MCKCGCRGWCSLHPLLDLLRWDFEVAGNFTYPRTRHDCTSHDNEIRQLREGQALPTTLAIVQLRGDWPAFCEVGGYRVWSHKTHPCFMCDSNLKSLGKLVPNITVEDGPWKTWTPSDYDDEVGRCKMVPGWVRISFVFVSHASHGCLFVAYMSTHV
jgi:hypothetical protein